MKKILSFLTSFALVLSIIFPTSLNASSVDGQAPVMHGLMTNEIEQTAPLTDNQLIDLFSVGTDDHSEVYVVQNYVDFTTPGTYQVGFGATNDYGSSYFPAFLTITDKKSGLTTQVDSVKIMEGSTNVDYVELYGATATEITTGDLTDQIVVDDSNVYLNQAGTYEVIFSVVDSQGNVTTKTVELVVVDGHPTVEGSYYERVSLDDTKTDQELIALFDVVSSESNIVVDQSIVDYSTKGQYNITFKATNGYGTTVHPAIIEVV